jgi:tetratricopeptide (TPR) repeat protein
MTSRRRTHRALVRCLPPLGCLILGILAGCEPRPDPPQESVNQAPLTGLAAARQLIMSGQWRAATDSLRAAGRNGADADAVALGLAQVQLATGHSTSAREQLAKVSSEAEELPLCRVLRAWLLAAEGQSLRSQAAARAVLAAYPSSVEARVLLARLALQAAATMDLSAARALCTQVLEIAPEHRVAGRMLVEATLRSGSYPEAVSLGQQQFTRHPNDGYLQLLVGTAAFWDSDHETASAALRLASDRFADSYTDRLKALWLLRLVQEDRGGAVTDLPAEYQFYFRSDPASVPSVPLFVDVADSLGVDKIDRGRGSSWLDYDGDGDWDLFSVGIHVEHGLYRNDQGTFTDQTDAMDLADPQGGWGASAADCDDDGDPDLFVTRDAWEGVAPNSLYRNDGDAGFSDIADAAGVAGPQASFTATWGDFDVDGRLDLYVANGVISDGGANSLHHNDSVDGTIVFSDVAVSAGVADTLKTVGTATGDYDADGWPDIYSVNIGGPNRLYRNQMGTTGSLQFVDTAPASGVVFPVEGGYVSFFLDFDNDGALDLFVSTMSGFEDVLRSAVEGRATEPNRPFLYHNEGDGTFTDVAVLAGLGRSFGTMGAGVGDVDNDGSPDLYLANGGPEMSRMEPNVLFLQRGDGTFADVTQAAGVGNLGKGHGATFADYDADGDVDLYAGLGGHYNADVWPNALYRNDGPTGASLAIRAMVGHRDAIGARIAVHAGEQVVRAQIASGFGFGSTNAPPAVAGLGSAAAESIVIVWPDGRRQAWSDVPASGHLTLRQDR